MIELFYGGRYAESVPLIRILATQVPVIGIDIVLASVLVAADRQRAMVVVGIFAAFFNPLVNLVAVPATVRAFDNGAIGASAVTVLTELVVLSGFLFARPPGVFDRATCRQMLRATVAAASMVPVLLALSWTPLLLRIVVGAVVYGVAALALRAVRIDEVRGWVASLASRPAPVAPLSSAAPFSEGAAVP
jgi:O-antigen/teichoic acid export membrane protein